MARRLYDPKVVRHLNELISEVGGDPESLDGQLIRELLQSALQLIPDQADTGELKLMSKSFRELRYGLKVFRPYEGTPKVSVFGSARTPIGHPHYEVAADFSRQIAGEGWMVITGAGDGIMRAGNDGAGVQQSFGVAIKLPFEQENNDIIDGDEKLVTFRYFFTRKLMFVSQADAVALFPGGFGTQDEGFEVLTLIQTGKTPMIPLVLVDEPGGTYWNGWESYVSTQLLGQGMISPNDRNLFFVTDDSAEAVRHVLQYYRNFHSQRFVRDRLVLRLKRRLCDEHLEILNDEFDGLVAEGRIEQSDALPGEETHLELPRLSFVFTKRDYGRLRLLIDRINEFDVNDHDEDC